MARNKTAAGLLGSRTEYNRYYGDFRGVDFSSDHTQVDDHRLAYLVNMYRDYGSGEGKALETVPGFRIRAVLPEGAQVYGIHVLRIREGAQYRREALIHAGSALYVWRDFPRDVGVEDEAECILPESGGTDGGVPVYTVRLADGISAVTEARTALGEDITGSTVFDTQTGVLTVTSSDVTEGTVLYLKVIKQTFGEEQTLYRGMNGQRSISFTVDGKLYLLDGKSYLVYDGKTLTEAAQGSYVPTTYINASAGGIGTEYMQRNLLSPYFRNTFIADGETGVFHMSEDGLEAITEVKVYGKSVSAYTADLAAGTVTLSEAPAAPENTAQEGGGSYPEGYAGIEITAKKAVKNIQGASGGEDTAGLIASCRYAAVFDNRVFLSGSALAPNHIFYCERNESGAADPTYFGALNYMQDGIGDAPIRAMLPVADTLMVLKGDAKQDGTVFFHTAQDTDRDIQPKIYPSVRGLFGVGCVGDAVSFLDDPVFVSRMGIDAMGQLSARYERAVEHRSSLIDAKLSAADMESAVLTEWNGYLAMLIRGTGRMFLADSRQRYSDPTGVPQYEWYYLEDVGVYDGQYTEYTYAQSVPEGLAGKTVKYCTACQRGRRECTCSGQRAWIDVPLTDAGQVYDAVLDRTCDLRGTAANAPAEDGRAEAQIFEDTVQFDSETMSYPVGIYYTVHSVCDRLTLEHRSYEAHLCVTQGSKTGGVFRPASALTSIDGILYFGTENGTVCSFNTDKRGGQGKIAPRWYTFNGRKIFSGCATKMDNCGIPHLTKNTVKKSTVIKTGSFVSSAAKIKVRTNRKAYEQIARINSTLFSFEDTDFTDFSFETLERSLFAVKEKEKKWVEKQYFIYSDEYMKPFSLYYVAYRYVVSGKFKE